jgi:hypothetical protein
VAGALKSKAQETFLDKCLSGRAFPSDIDEFVEQWHSKRNGPSLRECLGFSEEEYGLWVEHPKSLEIILFARARNLELGEAAKQYAKGEAREVLTWLKKARQR